MYNYYKVFYYLNEGNETEGNIKKGWTYFITTLDANNAIDKQKIKIQVMHQIIKPQNKANYQWFNYHFRIVKKAGILAND